MSFTFLMNHYHAVEDLLKMELAAISSKLKKEAECIPVGDARDEFWEYHLDEIKEVEEVFPQFHRQSMLISTMSYVELQLRSLSQDLARTRDTKLFVDDLAGGGITQAQMYLLKVHDINVWEFHHWREIKYAKDIRNDVVHNAGKIQNLKTKKYIGLSNHLEIDDHDRIIIKSGYVPHLLHEIKKMFEKINIELHENHEVYFEQTSGYSQL